jgi:hypothetical protein
MWVLNITLSKYISGAGYDVLGNRDEAYKISKHLNEPKRYTAIIQAVSIKERERKALEYRIFMDVKEEYNIRGVNLINWKWKVILRLLRTIIIKSA